jgi:peptide/nickel transport system substrate-binding protein
MSTNRTRTRSVLLGVVVAILTVASACSSSDTESSTGATGGSTSDTVPTAITLAEPSEPTTGGTLSYGLGAETSDGWDPTTSRWAGSGTVVSHAIFDRLAEYDENHVAQPFLAESIESNADFTLWTIKVRSGVKFHDGTDLTADAVKINLDKQKTSILTGAALQIMGDVTVVDSLTLTVAAKSSWATFPSTLTSQAGTVAAPSQFTDPQPAQNPSGTGPFTFESWRQDSELKVKKNPNYWMKDSQDRQLPYLDAVDFKVLADVQSRSAALESDAVQAIETFDPSQIKEYQAKAESGQYQMYSNQNREEAVQFIGLNTVKAPFDDPLARQIVAYGLDTQTISTTQYRDVFPVATGLFPTSSPFYAETDYPSYDPAKAAELHEEYKTKYGQPLSFTVNLPSTPEFKAIGELAKEQAAANGVEVTLNLIDQSTLIVDAVTGNFEATGFITFGDPNIDQIFFSNDTIKPLGDISLNFTRMQDDQLTDDLHAARATDVESEQVAAWQSAQEQITENLNILFVVRNGVAVIYDTNVFGFLDSTLPDGQPMEMMTSPYVTWAYVT